MQDLLIYDEETQRPNVKGKRVLGVSDVLKLSGIMDGFQYGTDYHLWMGQARHKAVELWVKGTLDLNSVHADILPSIEAFLTFSDNTGFIPTATELKVWHAAYQVATRIDLLGKFPDGARGIVELKSGTVAKPTAIQTAGQAVLMGVGRDTKRYGLSIPKTGKPVVTPYNDQNDFVIWMSAMNIAHWKMKNSNVKL